MAWPYDEEDIPPPPEGFEPDYSSGTDYTSGTDFTEGTATTFGYNDPGESTTGAWGYQLNDPDAYGVSLNATELRNRFGDEDAANGALVEVTNANTGRTIYAPIVDKGPADWVIARQGPTIDLTEGARRDIGGTGYDPVRYRIIGKPPEGFESEAPAGAGVSAGAIPPAPEGFVLEGLNIQDAVDPKAPYMSKPRDPSKISRIIMHGDVNEDADALVAYGRQVDPQRGFAPGYHFYVARDGTIKQGAPVDRITNHTLGENSDSIGIVIAGADEGKMPTPEQESAAKLLISDLGTQYGIDNKNVIGHGELQPHRRNALEGGNIARDIREQGYFGGGQPAATQEEIPPTPEGFVPEIPEMRGPGNRDRLLTAIQQTEKAGYEVPHFIGKPYEPEGDRGPTKDMESLVAVLRKQESDLANKGDKTTAARVAEVRSYWENEIKTHGMTAEQWKAQTGEEEPQYPTQTPLETFSRWGQDFATAKQEYAQNQQAAGKAVNEDRAKSIAFQKATSAITDESAKALGLKNAAEAKRVFRMLPSNIMEADADTANRWFTEALRNISPESKEEAAVKKFKPEEGLAQTVERQKFQTEMAFPGEPGGPETLPRMSALDADRLGLKRWRDLETGFEVRRAGKPEERPAEPVYGGTPAPTPLVPKGYEGMSPADINAKLEAQHARLEAAKPDYRPEWAPPAPAAIPQGAYQTERMPGKRETAVGEYRPEWAPPPAEPGTTGGIAETVNNNIKAAQRGWMQGQVANELQKTNPDLARVADLQRKIALVPPSADYQRTWDDKVSPAESWKAFVKDPVGNLSQMLTESMATQLPTSWTFLGKIPEWTARGLAGGAVIGTMAGGPAGGVTGGATGAAVGAGTGFAEMNMLSSKASEYSASIIDSLQQSGVDVKNPAALQKAFNDPKLMATIRDRAEKKAVPVGILDGLSAAMGGRLFSNPAKKALGKAGQWVVELGVQALAGATGEAAGQVASEGKITSPRGVIAEAAGELGGGIGEVAVGRTQQALTPSARVAPIAPGPVAAGPAVAPAPSFKEAPVAAAKAPVAPAEAPAAPAKQKEIKTFAELPAGLGKPVGGIAAPEPEAATTLPAVAKAEPPKYEGNHPVFGTGVYSEPLEGKMTTKKLESGDRQIWWNGRPTDHIKTPNATIKPAPDPLEKDPKWVEPEYTKAAITWREPGDIPALQEKGFTKEQARVMSPRQVWDALHNRLTPQGLGTPVGGVIAPAPEAAAAAKPTEAEITPEEQETEVSRLMAEYQGGTRVFAGKGLPTAPAAAAPQNPQAVRRAHKILSDLTLHLSPEEQQRIKSGEAISTEQSRVQGLSPAQIEKELAPHWDALTNNPITKQLGIPVETMSADHPAEISIDDSGKITYRISPRALLAMDNLSGGKGQFISRSVHEELQHAGEMVALREQWQKEKAATPKFTDFLNKRSSKLWVDVQHALGVEAAPSERKALYQTVKDSYDVYYMSDITGAGRLKATAEDAGKVFNEIYARGDHVNWLSEFVRQARQQKEQGALSESTFLRIYNLVKGWLNDALARLKVSLPGVEQGKFGKEMQQHFRNIEATLAAKGVPVKPPAAPTPKAPTEVQRMGKGLPTAPQKPALTERKAAEKPAEKPKPRPKPESAEAEAARRTVRGPAIPAPGAPSPQERAKVTGAFGRRWSGVREVLRESPGMEQLGSAVARHVDLEAAYKGRFGAPLEPQGLPLAKRTANREFEQYWQTFHEQGRVAVDSLPIGTEARRLVDQARTSFRGMDAERERINLATVNPKTGRLTKHKPIGEYPQILSRDTLNAIYDNKNHQKEWNRLKDAMVNEGIVAPGTPEEIEQKAWEHVQDAAEAYLQNKGVVPGLRMPNMAYDYSLPGALRYISNWAERAALHAAFGPKVGTTGLNVFDHTRRYAADEKTRKYINHVESLAYGRTSDDPLSNITDVLTSLGVTTQLANPLTTINNLIGGVAMNLQQFGPRALNLINLSKAITEGKEAGLILSDMQNAMLMGESFQDELSKLTGFALKTAGFTASEKFVRGMAIVGAKSFFRSAMNAYAGNPTGWKAKQYINQFSRLGFNDPQALLDEGGSGPLFDTYLRRMVNRVQGGYTYADVPIWASSKGGRLINQYQKFGLEQMNRFDRDVVRPIASGDVMPMIGYLVLLGSLGAGREWLIEQIFGKKPRHPSWEEMKNRKEYGEILKTVFGYVTSMGGFGILGDKINVAREVYEGKKEYSELIPAPSINLLTDIAEDVQGFFDRRDYSAEGYGRLAEKLSDRIAAVRTSKQVMATWKDAVGSKARFAALQARRQDVSWSKYTTERLEKSLGIEKVPIPKDIRATEKTALKEKLNEHIALGEIAEAKALIREATKKLKDPKDREDLMDDLQASTEAKHPLGGGKARRTEVLALAKKTLPAGDYARYQRIGKEYENNARRANLFNPKPVSAQDRTEWRQKVERARKQRLLEPGIVARLMAFAQ